MQYCTIFSAVCLFCLVITSQSLPAKEKISAAVRSAVAPIPFKERTRGHIDFQFERQVHGDKFTFNGTILVQALVSQDGGNVHLHDDEQWKIAESAGSKEGTVTTSAEELSGSAPDTNDAPGGSIDTVTRTENGTTYHFQNIFSISPNSDLYPSSKHEPTTGEELSSSAPDTNEAPAVSQDNSINTVTQTKNGTGYDLKGLKGIYSPTPNTNDAADICRDSSIDTATRTQDGNSYFFKGDFYWRVYDDRIADGYPRKIKDDWNGLEGNLDASFTSSDGNTYFFKGKWYWKFINKEMEPDYPRLISLGFKGIPDNLDAAFVWGIDKKPHFFKGDSYWRFDSTSDLHVSSIYPQPISKWTGLPNHIDAAFHFENNRLYFFKRAVYYRFDDNALKVETQNPPYPRYTSTWWFSCAAIS